MWYHGLSMLLERNTLVKPNNNKAGLGKKWIRSFRSQDRPEEIKYYREIEALSLKRLTLNNTNITTSFTLC